MYQTTSFNNQNLSTGQEYSSSSTTRGHLTPFERHKLKNVRQIDDSFLCDEQSLAGRSNLSKTDWTRNANATLQNIEATIPPRPLDQSSQTMPNTSPRASTFKKPRRSQISLPKVDAARGKHSKTTQRIRPAAGRTQQPSLDP